MRRGHPASGSTGACLWSGVLPPTQIILDKCVPYTHPCGASSRVFPISVQYPCKESTPPDGNDLVARRAPKGMNPRLEKRFSASECLLWMDEETKGEIGTAQKDISILNYLHSRAASLPQYRRRPHHAPSLSSSSCPSIATEGKDLKTS